MGLGQFRAEPCCWRSIDDVVIDSDGEVEHLPDDHLICYDTRTPAHSTDHDQQRRQGEQRCHAFAHHGARIR
jgi:hypothetical protein